MEGKRLIQRLALRDFLSYGSEGAEIDLLPLNVLIGPNASGKSNLIEALAVLRAAAGDLPAALRVGGGMGEYVWKSAGPGAVTSIEAVVEGGADLFLSDDPLRYRIGLAQQHDHPRVVEELIRQESPAADQAQSFYELEKDRAVIWQRTRTEDDSRPGLEERQIRPQDLARNRSILSQRRDPEVYPELTYLAGQFDRIAIYQEWTFGYRAPARMAQPTDLPADFLLPNGSNLVLVLHDLLQTSETEERIGYYLRRFYDGAERIRIKIVGGSVQLFIDEGMNELVPAARLSDGTLRYLALLAILLHPSPPPLVCIEEPELGLHPDIFPTIAELLRDASQRTQLVVTTHSDVLVSALSEVSECVVVCEPTLDGTRLRRLDHEQMEEWLDRYSLGELWRIGQLGGTRW